MSGIARRRANAAARDNPGYRARVKEIRRAAGRVFHERGFHATTLSDVAEAAQMDRATLYYYVGSKQQLFRDVVAEAVKANIDAAEQLAEDPRSSPEKVRALIEQLMNSFEEHFPFMYVMIQEDATKLGMESAGDDEWLATFREWNARYFSAVAAVIQEGIRDGSLNSTLPVRVITNALVGMITSSRAWFTPGGPMSSSEVAAGMSQLFLDGLVARRVVDEPPGRHGIAR